jgi:hypothetical protein
VLDSSHSCGQGVRAAGRRRRDELRLVIQGFPSSIGVAAIRGLQGAYLPIDDQHIMATAKHFAVHGQPESGSPAAPANYAECEHPRIFLEAF